MQAQTGRRVTVYISSNMSIYKKGFKQPEFSVFPSGAIFFEQTPMTNNNNKVSGAWGSEVKWLRTCAALTKVPGSILGTHRMASVSWYLHLQRIGNLLVSLGIRHVHGVHTCMQAENTHTLKRNLRKISEAHCFGCSF